jgi:hypothetical protein
MPSAYMDVLRLEMRLGTLKWTLCSEPGRKWWIAWVGSTDECGGGGDW